ncbi:MAG: pectate lyase [Ponticaulis sp.]|nr:pectate lyase [Ponticaulis sp.]
MLVRAGLVSLVALAATACASNTDAPVQNTVAASGSDTEMLQIDGFSDAIHHWQNRYGEAYPRYDLSQVKEIADNILLMQRDHGGWIQNQDPMRILTDADVERYTSDKGEAFGSFDNRNIYTQIAYLIGAYERVGDERYKAAALKGLDYLLEHQIDGCGGWPHSVNGDQRYFPLLTIADEVTSGPQVLLRSISERDWPFGRLSDDVVASATAALKAGDACVLRLQVRQGDQLAGWAGQYDPVTLEPAMGRTFELPSIAVDESVSMLRYLMSIDGPSDDVIASVEGGVSWLKQNAIHGTRLEEFDLPEPIKFRYHTSGFDRRLVTDPDAPLLWGRFYDVTDNSVVLANRDSVRVEDYQQIDIERRTGYNWYGVWPNELLEVDYPAWQCRTYGKSC